MNPVERFIPYKNSEALTSYYLSVAALIPCSAFLFGILAIYFGIKGLHNAKAHPEVKGRFHALTGIWLGAICIALNLAAPLAIVIAIAMNANR